MTESENPHINQHDHLGKANNVKFVFKIPINRFSRGRTRYF
jgi:hypothetical protein